MTINISWSSLRNHEECHQRSSLIRQGKRNKRQDQRGFFPGTVSDRVVRDWLLNDPEDHIGEMPDMVEEILNREENLIAEEGGVMRWKHLDDRSLVLRECQEAVRKAEPIMLKYIVPYDYTPDFRFSSPVVFKRPDGSEVNVLLNGAMDILVRPPSGFWVWDLKHTRNNDYWRKVEGQLTFYDLSVSLLFGESTQAVALLQPLCDDRVKKFVITQEKRNALLSRVESMAFDILDGVDDLTTESNNCYYCSVKHACKKFQPTMVGGKKKVKF